MRCWRNQTERSFGLNKKNWCSCLCWWRLWSWWWRWEYDRRRWMKILCYICLRCCWLVSWIPADSSCSAAILGWSVLICRRCNCCREHLDSDKESSRHNIGSWSLRHHSWRPSNIWLRPWFKLINLASFWFIFYPATGSLINYKHTTTTNILIQNIKFEVKWKYKHIINVTMNHPQQVFKYKSCLKEHSSKRWRILLLLLIITLWIIYIPFSLRLSINSRKISRIFPHSQIVSDERLSFDQSIIIPVHNFWIQQLCYWQWWRWW